jgi:hypothetical protein
MKQLAKYNIFKSKSFGCRHRTDLSILIFFQIILLICMSGRANAQNGFEGDTDGNWIIDQVDLNTLCSRWLDNNCGEPNWCGHADFDQNQKVDLGDFAILIRNWQS